MLAETGGEVLSVFRVVSTDPLLTTHPSEITGSDEEIGGMGAAGELPATRAMTILKHTHIPGDFVPHLVAETAAVDFLFRHDNSPMFSVLRPGLPDTHWIEYDPILDSWTRFGHEPKPLVNLLSIFGRVYGKNAVVPIAQARLHRNLP